MVEILVRCDGEPDGIGMEREKLEKQEQRNSPFLYSAQVLSG